MELILSGNILGQPDVELINISNNYNSSASPTNSIEDWCSKVFVVQLFHEC